MASPPKLSGETLIVHHIPLIHCQVSGGRQRSCGGSLKRSNPFSPPENLGLSRTTSLPERDVLQREALVYSSLIQTSAKREGGVGAGRGGSTASDDSSYTSSNSEDQPMMAHTLPRAKPRNRGNPLRHNPFLLNTEDDEEEEEDGDNLNGYLEDSSFHLHGDTNSVLNDGVPPFHFHNLGFPPEPFMLHGTLGKAWGSGSRESLRGMASDLSAHLNLDLLGLDCQRRHGSSGSNMSMDCGEQEWGEDEEDEEEDHPMRGGGSTKTGSSSSSSSAQRCSCCGLSQTYPQHFPEAFPEPFSECHQGYTSDSSCNSSDGVLVNFSAIYNKMNNGVPAKAPPGPTAILNTSAEHSSISSVVSEPTGEREGCNGGGGAFYLDLHTSPTEPCQPQRAPCLSNTLPVFLQEPLSSPASTTNASCTCSVEHQGGLDLDANCNTYQNHLSGSAGDLVSCLQSQARLVVATQNYYKLVTCDLSSQSSPSPAGSSVTSCSDEQSKGSPTPTQPTQYFLFRHQAVGKGMEEKEEEEDDRESSRRDNDEDEEEEEEEEAEERETKQQMDIAGTDPAPSVIEGQVYVNISPPTGSRGSIGGGASEGRPRSRSYDRNLDKSPSPRLGSLERMLSCPVRLSEGAAHSPPPPPRVTSFAEIARCKRRNGGSPLLRMGTDPFSSTHSAHSHSSADFSPILEQHGQVHSHSLPPVPFTRCYSQGSVDRQSPGGGTRETRDRTEGGLSTSSDGRPAVVRYSKDQRPTTLPIQPFTFHHQFSKPQPKTLFPLLTGYVSGMQARAGSGGSGGQDGDEEEYIPQDRPHCLGTTSAAVAPPGSVRPSPLGSYSPVRLQGAPSSGTCSTCTPSPQPARGLSCPLSAGLLASHTPPTQTEASAPLPPTPPPPALGVKRRMVPPTLPTVQGHCYYQGSLPALPALPNDILSLVEQEDTSVQGPGARQHHGQSVKQLQQCYSDFLPDYFSLTERPPEEFCLSPDASTSSSSSTTTHSEISVDLQHKRGLVKAINTAVDLIVAHFGTSRDPDVKAKLGNSWVSPNVGHLILKYLCPALRELLQDGLKAYVLDLIIGQRRNQPWSLVEASTQLGPSTRMLHNLFSKVSQYSELTSHSMRLNAFIFGLLNLRSLEFWFNHLYTHEDILAVHYHPWGFLPLSQGPCQPLFEELLLLLQPLSLLPFDLDLLFEPHLFQKGQEHLRRKEQLCSAGLGLNQSTRSTFQLMRGWSTTVAESMREGVESGAGRKERAELRREGTWPRMENMGLRREGTGPKLGPRKDAAGMDSTGNTLGRNQPMMEEGLVNLWRERGVAGQRLRGVGGENHQKGTDREKDEKKERVRVSTEEGRQRQERQAGWWYQLMQSSQVYIDQSAEGSKFAKSEKRKKSLERRQSQLPPTREGVVEGAESSQGEGLRERSRKSSSSSDSAVSRGRPSWMGSPPDSVLSQEKEKVQGPPGARPAGAQPLDEASSQGMRWGRLFGSSLGSPSRSEAAESRQGKSQTSRLPSGWLSLDRSVLDFVVQTVGVGSGKRVEPSAPPLESLPTSPPPPSAQVAESKSPCEVKALCHHIATEPGQLSFHKGDVLRVLGRADSDWLLCSLGAIQGLVPIIYVTLRSLDDNQGPGEGGPH